MNHPVTEKITQWYLKHARDLPWRSTSDPYAIWVSEIMLQQTRVKTVIPYYLKWLNHFPTLEILAAASQKDVLKVWEGLGYYARARNMHRCAQQVADEFNGKFPLDFYVLLKLPGIGPYTAAAICSFAYHQNIPAIDANLKRVLARLFNLTSPVNDPKSHHVFTEQAQSILPAGKSSAFNQGLMDLGALVCMPKNPHCSECSLQADCVGFQSGLVDQLPIRLKAKKKPQIIVTAAIINNKGKYLITQRPENGLLGGMWEFPGGKQEKDESLEECLQREICEELGANITIGEKFGIYQHSYTHFHVTLHAFQCTLLNNRLRAIEVQDMAWVQAADLETYPMGKIDRTISNDLLD